MFTWPQPSPWPLLAATAFWELVAQGRTCIIEQNGLYCSLEPGEQEGGENKGILHP